jgi:Domain of unknown function (DUF4126)
MARPPTLDHVDLVPMVVSSGWASGVNAYLVVLMLGLADRAWQVADIPDVLGRTDVLVVAGVLFAIEFVADKIPYVDSTWDAISTAIRPTVGAIIAVLLAGDVSTLEQAVMAVLGGGTALASHGVKAGLRLAVNTSPEPVTNTVTSVVEDLTVAGVVVLAFTHPWIALAVCLVLLVFGGTLFFLLVRRVRRRWRRWRGWHPGEPRAGIDVT